MSRYWEASGKLKGNLQTYLDQLNTAFDAADKLAKKYGAVLGYATGAFGLSISFSFKNPPDPKTWKEYHDSFYKPKRSTKLGKQISDEVDQIQGSSPKGFDAAHLIGMSTLSGDRFHSPGLTNFNGRIIVVTHDEYTPKGKIKNEMKRISDTEYERLEAKKKAKS